MDSEIRTGETFEFTNVKPITEDLQNLIETIEMLETYKSLFNEDVETLAHVGNLYKSRMRYWLSQARKLFMIIVAIRHYQLS